MKKQVLAMVVSAMAFGGMSMGIAHATDGTINFTGTVTADTCTVAVNDQTNPTLNLGTVNATDLAAAGDTGPATNFTLNLTSCPTTVTAANVTFSGNADSALDTAFKNEATSGAATNVGVQLYNADASKVTPDTAVDVSTYLTADAGGSTESAAVPFTARMIAVAAKATAGSLVSHADYTISYE